MIGWESRVLFRHYLAEGLTETALAERLGISRRTVTRWIAQFEANLSDKARDPDFRDDIPPLLRRGITWDLDDAVSLVSDAIIAALPGEPWKRDRA